MLETIKALTTEYDMLPRGGTVLCAVSGGADSMCLLHLLHTWAGEGGFRVAAAHYNHNLRGAESDRDAAFVAEWCAGQDIPCVIGAGDVAHEARARGLGVEETLLLHLVRGAGLHGLAGIPPRRGVVVRPLLTTSRAEIVAYLEANGVAHVEDSSNTDEGYARNRIRRQVVPVLRQLNPRLTESAAETMGYLRTDNDYLNAQAAAACQNARWAEDDLVIEARYIAQLPAAIAPRAVRRLLEMMGDGSTNCSAAHLKAVVELARGDDPSAVVFLPGGRLAQRVYRELLLTTQSDPLPPFLPTPLALDGETEVEGTPWRVRCRPVRCPDESERKPGALYLAQGALEGPLVLRPRQTGDAVTLPGRGGTKTLKKLFIDEKVPRRERERIPVLADGRGVAAVAGFGPEQSRTAVPGQAAYELLFWKKE